MKEIPAQISKLRERIDAIDDEIIQLLSKRIMISSQLMALKAPTQVIDPSREEAIIQRYLAKLGDTSTPKKVSRLVAGILAAAKTYPD